MATKPIIFSTPMVKAILDGNKTMTRRVIKPQPEPDTSEQLYQTAPEHAPYKSGDILWVRETWAKQGGKYLYTVGDGSAENYRLENGELRKWKPSIYMPKEAARIFLHVTDIRAERLQEISFEDIAREALAGLIPTSTSTFRRFWDTLLQSADLHKYGWDANPWVWVISFECCEKPDKFPG